MPLPLKPLGVACLVAAALLALGTAVLVSRVRPAFMASTLFTLTAPTLDAARLADGFRDAQAKFPERMKRAPRGKVTLEPAGKDLFRLSAIEPDPLSSVETANMLTLLLRDSLIEPGASGQPPLKLLETAQPPTRPTRSDVKGILRWGMGLGGGVATLGAVLLAMAATRRERQEGA